MEISSLARSAPRQVLLPAPKAKNPPALSLGSWIQKEIKSISRHRNQAIGNQALETRASSYPTPTSILEVLTQNKDEPVGGLVGYWKTLLLTGIRSLVEASR
ncbi:hypothetical protein V6N13_125510 [Hibiscus sabdariffa]|uniref:Uncharacterized protein n=1 Tax=Hibiscus sabdariffa TaxID=183260 RepID=A0ABR2U6I5_9ROSI